jgi:hypothetical protein
MFPANNFAKRRLFGANTDAKKQNALQLPNDKVYVGLTKQ